MSNYPLRTKKGHDKKGYTSTEVFGALIIMILIIIVSVQMYQKFVVGPVKILECTQQGGECVVGTCAFPSQIPFLSDKAAGCDVGKLCCINVTRRPIDPLCMNAEGTAPLPVGMECDDNMFCDQAQVCVTRCELCSKNYNFMQTNELINTACKDVVTPDAKEKFGKGDLYSCRCTQEECNNISKRCVTSNGLCINEDAAAQDYSCCAK